MDPISVGLFIFFGILFVAVFVRLHDVERREIAFEADMKKFASNVSAAQDPRIFALELENRTIKADIAEIKAVRRTEVERARQAQSRPASFKAFRNQIKGTEIEP